MDGDTSKMGHCRLVAHDKRAEGIRVLGRGCHVGLLPVLLCCSMNGAEIITSSVDDAALAPRR